MNPLRIVVIIRQRPLVIQSKQDDDLHTGSRQAVSLPPLVTHLAEFARSLPDFRDDSSGASANICSSVKVKKEILP
jgi:hypothetical protein